MSKLNVEDFLDYLRRSELTDESRLKSTLDEIFRSNDPEKCQDADFVASELVRYKLITNWHVRQLMKKKYKGFYLRQYRILGHLGSGGMSTVYLAEHTIMQRQVAIKVLPKKRLSNNVYLDRFIREAQASASLDHPNIVRAYDIDRSDDIHYIVMEYFEGTNLRQLVEKEGPLPFEDAVNYLRQGAEGLIHAHRIGVIHRDIKPENILVNDKGIAKILDLGLALLDETIFNQPLSSINEDKILGTADYLAPEQALDSHNVDARADIYSLGCTLYYCLTGHAPFPFGTISQRLLAHQKETPSNIFKDRPDAPQDLVEICLKMMEKKPELRFQSATEVVRTLERWLVHHGFAEINDFPALAHLVELETMKSDSSENDSFGGIFSFLSNSENATEHGSNRSFQFNGDSIHSGVGNEDVVNLFGSETGITSSRSFSGSKSSLGFGSNSAPPEEMMLSKNAFLSSHNASLDPLVLAMNEIETEIIESSEKFVKSQQKTNLGQNIENTEKTKVVENAKNLENTKKTTDSHQKSGTSQLRELSSSISKPKTTESVVNKTINSIPNKTDTQPLSSSHQTSKIQGSTDHSTVSGKKETKKVEAKQSETDRLLQTPKTDKKRLELGQPDSSKDETSLFERPLTGLSTGESLNIQPSSKLLSESNNLPKETRDQFVIWYKEIPFWFWVIFAAGYVLATFLAGILFALLLNLNR